MSASIRKIGKFFKNRERQKSPLNENDDDHPNTNQNVVSKDCKGISKRRKTLEDLYYYERSRAMRYSRKESMVPPVTTINDDDELLDIDDSQVDNLRSMTPFQSSSEVTADLDQSSLWSVVYVPKPIVDQSSILLMGCFWFIIARIWTPILLVIFILGSYIIPYCFRENDMASSRRQLFQQFLDFHTNSTSGMKEKQHESLTKELTVPEEYIRLRSSLSSIQLEQSYWTNSRGMLLNTIIMTPPSSIPIQSVICYCHGYTESISYTKLLEFQRFVQRGIAIVAIEYEGHGLSDGLFGYIEDWNRIIDDVSSFFSYILNKTKALHDKPTFLMGESMGGAVAYDVYHRVPHLFQQPYGGGVIFLCPMCKISDDMLPSPILIDCLKRLLELVPWIGYLPLAPTKTNLENVAYRISEKHDIASLSPLNYSRKPRLSTARELLDTTVRMSETFHKFDASFLILHGKDDAVTDPFLSQQMYSESRSNDKTIYLYDNMWHSLLSGETEDNITRVTNDIIQWIEKRSITNPSIGTDDRS